MTTVFLDPAILDAESGLTDFDLEVVQLKKAMIRSSKQIISLSISEKLGTLLGYKVCDLATIDTLVTELDPYSSNFENYR